MISPLASPFRGGWRNLTPMRGRGRGGVAWSPANLTPYTWYDANIGGSTSQITDSSGNGRDAATFGATTATPVWLPYTTPAVYLTGVASSYISAPDGAALSFSNDVEVVCRIKPVDWTAAANQTIAGKYVTSGNQRSWRFYISTTGTIGLTASTDGTAVTSCVVTPSPALTDNTWIWLRLRLDLDNGSNSVGTVETAADTGSNDDVPTVWTSAGSATSTTISGVFDGTAPLEIGSFATGASERFNGWIGRVIVRNGFAGTDVADFNATLCGQTGYTGTLGNVWTVNRPTAGLKTAVQSPAASSTRSLILFGTDDNMTIPDAAIPNAAQETWIVVVRQWGTAVAAGRYISNRLSSTTQGISIYPLAGNIQGSAQDGSTSATFGDVAYTTGQRLVIEATMLGAASRRMSVNNTSNTNTTALAASPTGKTGYRVGSTPVPNSFQDFEFYAALFFDRALTTGEIAQLVTYYGGGV